MIKRVSETSRSICGSCRGSVGSPVTPDVINTRLDVRVSKTLCLVRRLGDFFVHIGGGVELFGGGVLDKLLKEMCLCQIQNKIRLVCGEGLVWW